MFLITQTLLSSYAYQFSCMEDAQEEAREAFERTLRREKSEPTEATQNGIEFESLVYSIAAGTYAPQVELGESYRYNGELIDEAWSERLVQHRWYKGAKQIADIIVGAPSQVKASREITVDGMDFLVYGILDALKAGTIYDIKFKNKGFGSLELAGSYMDSPQHPAYFYIVPEAYRFVYLISDGEDFYQEQYTPDTCPFVGDLIHEFLRGITPEQMEIYKERWVSK